MLNLKDNTTAISRRIQCALTQRTYAQRQEDELMAVRSKVLETTPETFVYRKETIGSGATARVYLGMDVRSEGFYAIKEVSIVERKREKRGKPSLGPKFASRVGMVLREARSVEKLDNFGQIFRVLSNPHKTKVFMFQNVFSGTIEECVSEMSKLTSRELILPYIAREITISLRELESKQILHFDINPANICYSRPSGVIEFIDFGCSDIGISCVPGGSTEGYSTINHFRGDECSPRDNLFSLGATFCELALAAPPIGDFELARTNQEKRVTNPLPGEKIKHFDLQSYFNGNSEGSKKLHFQEYFKDLTNFNEDFSQICKKMLDIGHHRELSSEDVLRSLDSIIEGHSESDMQRVGASWNELSMYGKTISRQMDELRNEYTNIKNGNRRLIKEKKL